MEKLNLQVIAQMVEEGETNTITRTLYQLGAYLVHETYYGDKRRISVEKDDYSIEYLPHIYETEGGKFGVQTTSYGAVTPDELDKIIECLNYAKAAAEYINNAFAC